MKNYAHLIILVAILFFSSACSSLTSSITHKPVRISVNLPQVDKTSIKTLSSMNSIAIEWKAIGSRDVIGYYIYRTGAKSSTSTSVLIATIDNKFVSHFVDTKLEPGAIYFYSIASKGIGNVQSKPSAFKAITKRRLKPVSFIASINGLPRQTKIIWRPHTNQGVEKYIIERSEVKKANWKDYDEVAYRLSAEYIDKGLRDNVSYAYRIKAVTFDGVVSLASKVVVSTTKALPTGVQKVRASKLLPRKIVLEWEPSVKNDIRGYGIYVSKKPDGGYRKIANPAPDKNAFSHTVNENGAKRYYKITIIDKDKLESDIKNLKYVVGTTLTSPMKPIITKTSIANATAILAWEKGDDRSIAYNIRRSVNGKYFDKNEKIFRNIKETKYVDSSIARGISYGYQLQSIDQFGLVSKWTEPATLRLPLK